MSSRNRAGGLWIGEFSGRKPMTEHQHGTPIVIAVGGIVDTDIIAGGREHSLQCEQISDHPGEPVGIR